MAFPQKSAVTDDPHSISLEPDQYAHDCWVLEFATDQRRRVEVALSPSALHQLHLEARSVSTTDRDQGRSAPCDVCGEQVDLFLALPNTLGRPVHRDCYSEEYGANWVSEYP